MLALNDGRHGHGQATGTMKIHPGQRHHAHERVVDAAGRLERVFESALGISAPWFAGRNLATYLFTTPDWSHKAALP
jgi:hypothetical protein